LLAVGSSVAILATPQGLTVAKGAKISGTWSVDDGDANAIDTTVTTANAVSMDVPNSAEAVQALVSGKTLTVKVDGKSYAMPLGDMTQAFTSLSECMVKNQK
jgi:invasion protein IalB